MKSDKLYIVDGRVVAAKTDQFVLTVVPNGFHRTLSYAPETVNVRALLPEHQPLMEALADDKHKKDQETLDRTWKHYDKAATGDAQSIEFISMRRAFGAPMPTARTVERKVQRMELSMFEWSYAKARAYCQWCDCEMIRLDHKHRHKFCSNTCADASAADHVAARGKYEYYTPKTLTPVACAHCAAAFSPKRNDARYCSVKCRVAAHRVKT